MKLLILGRNQPSDTPIESPQHLARALAVHGDAEVTARHYEDLVFTLSNSQVTITDASGDNIASYGAALFTDWFARKRPFADTAFATASYLHAKNVPFLNSEVLSRSSGKVSQYMLFALNDVPMPATIFCHDIAVLLERAQKTFGFPFVVKASAASRGAHNYVVGSEESLHNLRTHLQPLAAEVAFVAQEFLPNEGDYRIIVAGGRAKVVIWRQPAGDTHLNNTSAGGSASLIPLDTLDPQWLAIAERAALLLRREVSGVDLLVPTTTKKPVILEVNNMPQLATGTFVAEKTKALYDALQTYAAKKEQS